MPDTLGAAEYFLLAGLTLATALLFLAVRLHKKDWDFLDYGTPAQDPDEQRKRLNGEL